MHSAARPMRAGYAALVTVTGLAVLAAPATALAQPADDATPLHRAAHEGDAAAVERLLDHGRDADAATRLGVTPLALACAGGTS